MIYVGNDIVDLQNCHHDPRFLKRICSEEEWSCDKMWIFWAIKEASYKLLKKIDPNTVFIPKYFVVSPNQRQCRYRNFCFSIETVVTEDYVHAIAGMPNSFPITTVIQETVRNESEFVRSLGVKSLVKMGYLDCEIRERPPKIYQQGKLNDTVDISLSHDGRFSAVAIGEFQSWIGSVPSRFPNLLPST